MADDPTKKPKPKVKPPMGKGPPGAPPMPPMDDAGMEDDPTAGMGGGGQQMAPPFGGSPPMPGQGVDPYAALQGLIMQGPPPPGGSAGMNSGGAGMGTGGMDMPMGPGPGGDIFPGGGAGMGMNLAGPYGTQGGAPEQEDELTRALMSDIDPGGGGPPTLPQHVFDPGTEQMSMEEILQMLALMQGGIPSSGVPPTPPSRGATSGIFPNDAWMTGA